MEKLKSFILEEYKYDGKLRFLLKDYTFKNIIECIMSLFSDTDFESHFHSSTILRDLFLVSDLNEYEKNKYLNTLKKMNALEYLASFLYASNYRIRTDTIFVIGKMSIKEYVKYLYNAFDNYYIFHDPISASKCIFEMRWLNNMIYPLKRTEKLFENKSSIFGVLSAEHFGKYEKKFVSWILSKEDFPQSLIKDINKKNIYKYVCDISSMLDLYINNILNTNKINHFSLIEIDSLYHTILNNYKDIELSIKNSKSYEEIEEHYKQIWFKSLNIIS